MYATVDPLNLDQRPPTFLRKLSPTEHSSQFIELDFKVYNPQF